MWEGGGKKGRFNNKNLSRKEEAPEKKQKMWDMEDYGCLRSLHGSRRGSIFKKEDYKPIPKVDWWQKFPWKST